MYLRSLNNLFICNRGKHNQVGQLQYKSRYENPLQVYLESWQSQPQNDLSIYHSFFKRCFQVLDTSYHRNLHFIGFITRQQRKLLMFLQVPTLLLPNSPLLLRMPILDKETSIHDFPNCVPLRYYKVSLWNVTIFVTSSCGPQEF